MSISPASGLALDAAQAAEPTSSSATAQSLRRLNEASGATDFASALELPHRAAGSPESVAPPHAATSRSASSVDPAVKARKGLEAFFLQGVVENILPKSEGLFGAGTSGEVWRSMLAEQIAGELSKSIDLGIADPKSGAHVRGALKAAEPVSTETMRHG